MVVDTKTYWVRLPPGAARTIKAAAKKRGMSRAALMALVLRRWAEMESSSAPVDTVRVSRSLGDL